MCNVRRLHCWLTGSSLQRDPNPLHYVNVGVEELYKEKLTPLLRLKYHDSIADAVADLGPEIGQIFGEF